MMNALVLSCTPPQSPVRSAALDLAADLRDAFNQAGVRAKAISPEGLPLFAPLAYGKEGGGQVPDLLWHVLESEIVMFVSQVWRGQPCALWKQVAGDLRQVERPIRESKVKVAAPAVAGGPEGIERMLAEMSSRFVSLGFIVPDQDWHRWWNRGIDDDVPAVVDDVVSVMLALRRGSEVGWQRRL